MFSFSHLVLIAIIALLLFGNRGKIAELMGEVVGGARRLMKRLAGEHQAITPPGAEAPAQTLGFDRASQVAKDEAAKPTDQ